MSYSELKDTTLNDIYLENLKYGLMVGEIVQFPIELSTEAQDFLKVMPCDGGTYDPILKSELASVISDYYGSSGSLYKVPNLISDTIKTSNNTHFHIRGRNNQTIQIDNSILGNNVLQTDNICSHSHNMDANHSVSTNLTTNFSTSNGYDTLDLNGGINFDYSNMVLPTEVNAYFNTTRQAIPSSITLLNSNSEDSQTEGGGNRAYNSHSHDSITPTNANFHANNNITYNGSNSCTLYTPPNTSVDFQYGSISQQVALNATTSGSESYILKTSYIFYYICYESS